MTKAYVLAKAEPGVRARGFTSSEKSSWSKSFAIAVLAIIRLIESLRAPTQYSQYSR